MECHNELRKVSLCQPTKPSVGLEQAVTLVAQNAKNPLSRQSVFKALYLIPIGETMVTKAELVNFFNNEFPQANFIIDSIGEKAITIRKKINQNHLRPGGTVSGPVLMEMADLALYVAILSQIGLVALAVTTNLNINFLRKPSSEKDIIAKCNLIKIGKTLIVGEVSMYSEGFIEPVAHAIGTYAIPIPNKT
ncbi:MAG: hypothetical protein ACI89Z_000867 [Porticoccus sp.]|jgi:uncharacterized protein (TIGR00369 family)